VLWGTTAWSRDAKVMQCTTRRKRHLAIVRAAVSSARPIEDSQINGGVTIGGFNGFWMGFIRNNVNGSVNLNNNVLVDPDGNEYVTNTIHGSLNCSGNSPAPQIGDSEGSPNHVTGARTGQCANL